MDARVFVEGEAVHEQFTWPDVGQVALYSNGSPAKETPNEDSALVAHCGDGRLVLAVADGVGGHAGGAAASRAALHSVRDAISRAGADQPLREAVLTGIDQANAAVLDLGLGAATTIAAVVIDQWHARAYHVGDSEVLAFGGRGKIKLQTISHSPVGFGVEAGFLEAEEARSHEDRHIVSNVIGDAGMHIGISAPIPLSPRDTLIIASDGLFDNLAVEEVIEVLRRGPLAAAVDQLVGRCSTKMASGGHPDDLTIVVYRPSESHTEPSHTEPGSV